MQNKYLPGDKKKLSRDNITYQETKKNLPGGKKTYREAKKNAYRETKQTLTGRQNKYFLKTNYESIYAEYLLIP